MYICVYEFAYVVLTRVYLSVRVSNLIMIIDLGSLLLPLPLSVLYIHAASFYSADIVSHMICIQFQTKQTKNN